MRTYDNRELLQYVESIEKFTIPTGTFGDTTIATTPLVEGDAAATVASITNFADENYIAIVGQGGEIDLNGVEGMPATGSIPLEFPAAIDAAIGSRVVQMTRSDLGHLDTSGVTLTGSGAIQDVPASTSRLPLASFFTGGQLGGSFNLMGFNQENLQSIFGMPESVGGAGTLANPHRARITGQRMGTAGLTCLRVRGIMADGLTRVILDFNGVTMAPSLNAQLGGTNPAVLGAQFRCTALIPRSYK